MPKLKTWSGDWQGSGGLVIPMQAWSDALGDYEILKSHGGKLLLSRPAAIAPVKFVAPAPSAAPAVVSAAAVIVLAMRLDVGAAVPVHLYNGSDSSDPRWQLMPGEAFAPAAPLLFPSGLAVRAVSGLVTVTVYLQIEAAT